MKDEIPQAVIDSHVKKAANARAEKAKQESTEENTGRLEILMKERLLRKFCFPLTKVKLHCSSRVSQ